MRRGADRRFPTRQCSGNVLFMGIGEHYVALQCACGHRVMTWLADWPESARDGWSIRDEALARMRCTVCGRRGRPAEIRIGWAAGRKEGREHVREWE